MSQRFTLKKYLPILVWSRHYDRQHFSEDFLAALIVAIMVIPQSLAYALVAGLPAQTGLYSAILGLSVYTFFGTSKTLSVGPVAVLSLMTAAALTRLTLETPEEYLAAAMALALLSGGVLVVLGLLRLGFIANFISHPVISAFITGSALIIAVSQLGHILGVEGGGQNLVEQLLALAGNLNQVNYPTLSLGLAALGIILWVRHGLQPLLVRAGISKTLAASLCRAGPLLVIILSSLLAWAVRLDEHGVALLGEIPSGLPALQMPQLDLALVRSLSGSALLIAIIGFVESVSVARVLAARRRERIDLDQELVGLGAANLASASGGGYPVCGGFSRSIVNFEAGAATPLAGLMTAVIIALVVLSLTPAFFWLPRVSLAAIIMLAVYPLIDFSMLMKSFRYSTADFIAVVLTLVLTLAVGVEIGVAGGVMTSVLVHLYKTSKPHVAVVGRVLGTEHFRNVERHKVETFESLLSIRVDESLYFANSQYLEEFIFKLVAKKPNLKHVILMCTAVNEIDLSALEALETINDTLDELGIKLHLSEVKGPIMDKLGHTGFFTKLTGNNYLSHNQAVEDLRVPA